MWFVTEDLNDERLLDRGIELHHAHRFASAVRDVSDSF
jgi:hypothetical protein